MDSTEREKKNICEKCKRWEKKKHVGHAGQNNECRKVAMVTNNTAHTKKVVQLVIVVLTLYVFILNTYLKTFSAQKMIKKKVC